MLLAASPLAAKASDYSPDLQGNRPAVSDGSDDSPPALPPTDPTDTQASTVPAESGSLIRRFRLQASEGDFNDRRNLLVPVYGNGDPSSIQRVFADGSFKWKPDPKVTLNLSGRLGQEWTADQAYDPSSFTFGSLREASVSTRWSNSTVFDAGRIIERNGVAYGGNPTDFFRGFSVVNSATWDSDGDRLGVAMARLTHIGEGMTWSLIYAPRLGDDLPHTDSDPRVHGYWDHTNWENRFFGKLTINATDNLSPELLLYKDHLGTSAGFNLAVGIGKAITTYVELAATNRYPLATESALFGRQVDNFQFQDSPIKPLDQTRKIRFDGATGMVYSYSTWLTVNAEYGYAGRALTRDQWNQWFAAGSKPGISQDQLAQIWYVRDYASAVQEPLTRNRVLLRAGVKNAFGVFRLSWDAGIYSYLDPVSTAYGFSLNYTWIDSTSLSLTLKELRGAANTDIGSSQRTQGVQISLSRYF